MKQLSKEKQELLKLWSNKPNQVLKQLGLDRVIEMSISQLEEELYGY